MKAFVHEGTKGFAGVRIDEFDSPGIGENDVKIKLKTAGLNHRDLFVLNLHDETAPPIIIGSDGAGIIEETGKNVTRVKTGDDVLVNPSLRWFEKSDAPPEDFRVLGLPDHGTFAEQIVLTEDQVEPKPAYLSWNEAGVLSLASLTAYRALFTRAGITKGDTVFLPGVGSGAVTFLLQFAKAAGARVIITSRSEQKREQALKLGADLALSSEENIRGMKVPVSWHHRARFWKQVGINSIGQPLDPLPISAANH